MSTKASKTPPPPRVNLEEHEGYARETALLAPLSAELGALKVEREELQRTLAALGSDPAAALDREALAIIGGGTGADKTQREILARLEEIGRRFRGIERAVTIQHGKVKALERAASAVACAKLAPRHRDIVKRTAAAMFALVAVLQEAAEFDRAICEAGIDSAQYLPPLLFHPLGQLGPDGPLARWIRRGLDLGLLEEADLPDAIRALDLPLSSPRRLAS